MPDEKIKVGLSQINTPAPLNYRKFLNVWFMTLSPGIAALVAGIPVTYKTSTFLLLGLKGVDMFLKAGGQLLGNGQRYTPSNETVEKKQSQELGLIFWVIGLSMLFSSY